MTPRFTILPAANQDLDDHAEYLAAEASLEAALRFYDAADESFTFLAQNPGVGAPRTSRNPALAGVRVWRVHGFAKHVIFYRAAPDGIEVVRVLHGHRDIDALLDLEP